MAKTLGLTRIVVKENDNERLSEIDEELSDGNGTNCNIKSHNASDKVDQLTIKLSEVKIQTKVSEKSVEIRDVAAKNMQLNV